MRVAIYLDLIESQELKPETNWIPAELSTGQEESPDGAAGIEMLAQGVLRRVPSKDLVADPKIDQRRTRYWAFRIGAQQRVATGSKGLGCGGGSRHKAD